MNLMLCSTSRHLAALSYGPLLSREQLCALGSLLVVEPVDMRLKHDCPQNSPLLVELEHPYMLHRNKSNDPWSRRPATCWGTSMFVTYILSKIRAYKLYRQTVQELSELSDRELADLGAARFDIARVARQGTFA
jgi:uncharacterized protein YjiS (DUF1127 family)